MKLHNRDTFAVEKIELPAQLGGFVLNEHGAELLGITLEEFNKRVLEKGIQQIVTREGLRMIQRNDYKAMGGQ